MHSSSNIEDILREESIQYRDKGKDVLIKCLNPEHDDDTPSLFVHKETGKFHCFSCGYKGNLYRHFGIFVSPVKDLVYQVGQQIMTLQSESTGLEIPVASVPFAEDYRGISAQAYIDHDAFIDSNEEYEGRIMFPIRDSTGKIILFNGRNQHSKVPPKYKYFPYGVALPVFPTHSGVSYNILVEGMLDYLNLYDKGMENVSTCFGTNSLTASTVEGKLLHQVLSGVSTFVLLFDNDKAGWEGAKKVQKALTEKLKVDVIIANHLLPDNEDPGSLNSMAVTILDRKIKKLLAN